MASILFLMSFLLQGAVSAPVYDRSYAIVIRGSVAGYENVAESRDRDGNVISTSDHEIFLDEGLEKKRMAFTSRMVFAKGSQAPLLYKVQYTSGSLRDSYEVTVAGGKLRRILRRGGQTSDITLPAKPDLLIIDFSVYHQYDDLVRRYDFKRKGRQSFSSFIPLLGSELPIALTHLSDASLDYGRGTIPVRNFKIEFVSTWTGTLSMDKDNKLVRLLIPSQDLEVVRKDLLPQE